MWCRKGRDGGDRQGGHTPDEGIKQPGAEPGEWSRQQQQLEATGSLKDGEHGLSLGRLSHLSSGSMQASWVKASFLGVIIPSSQILAEPAQGGWGGLFLKQEKVFRSFTLNVMIDRVRLLPTILLLSFYLLPLFCSLFNLFVLFCINCAFFSIPFYLHYWFANYITLPYFFNSCSGI